MDDEDEFVDAVEGRDELEETEDGEQELADGDDGGFGDDDFGDFGDFEEQQHGAEYDEEDLHEEYDPHAQEYACTREERVRIQHTPPIPPPIPIETPQIEFLDYKNKSHDQIRDEVLHYLTTHLSPDDTPQKSYPATTERLDNERAMSLWNQLAAPVPLNPPDWKRSRIRRLFLVSLGIPVNLDEILPASGKKKKLVLPSTKPETAGPTLSGKLPAPAPPFDPVAARHKAAVSTLALRGMTDAELLAHVETLKEMNSAASESLTYWLERRVEAVGEKESLEGVIESLVGWTERQRKGTTGIAMVPGRGKTPPPAAVQSGKKGRKK